MAQTSLLTLIIPRTCRLELLPAISSALNRAGAHTLASSSPPPPVPKKIPYEASAHGLTWQDPYHWMKNTNDPDFINYLNHENSYAQAFMSDTQTLQRTLFSEMKNRMPSNISTPPERWGPWFVHFHTRPFCGFSYLTFFYKFLDLFFSLVSRMLKSRS